MYFDNILEFSRHNCITICAFLVPANLAMTLQTLILAFIGQNPRYLQVSVSLGVTVALLQIFHVFSWFMIGVITPVTFILISLSSLCLFLNLWTLTHPILYRSLIKVAISKVQ